MQNRWFERRDTVEYLPSSPDLSLKNFFVLGFLKNKAYSRKPETIAEMRIAIERECAQIPEEMLLNVFSYISTRYKKCIEQNGTILSTSVNSSLCKHFEITPSVFYIVKS